MITKLEKILKQKKLLNKKEKEIIEQSLASIGSKVLDAFRQDRKQMKFEHVPNLLIELAHLDGILPGRRKRKAQQEEDNHGHDQGD
jgi:hypothetical protein